ncbi:MAG: hypothetical protein QXD13_02515 [Candidatus Pacearchaeota archaeon]
MEEHIDIKETDRFICLSYKGIDPNIETPKIGYGENIQELREITNVLSKEGYWNNWLFIIPNHLVKLAFECIADHLNRKISLNTLQTTIEDFKRYYPLHAMN